MQHRQPRRVLRSLNLALDVLEELTRERGPMALTEIATALDLSKAAVHGILSNLEARGYVEKVPGRTTYRLGHRVWELGIAAGDQIELRKVAEAPLMALTEKTGESTQLAEYWSPGEVLYLNRVVSSNPVQAFVRLGGRAPAYCVATGRALLAYESEEELERVFSQPLQRFTPLTITDPNVLRAQFEEVRQKGYALNRGEYRGEIVGIAAPVRNHRGTVVGAISVSGPNYRFSVERAESFAQDVIDTADEISRKLGYHPQPVAMAGGMR